jgi:hypothetical protein
MLRRPSRAALVAQVQRAPRAQRVHHSASCVSPSAPRAVQNSNGPTPAPRRREHAESIKELGGCSLRAKRGWVSKRERGRMLEDTLSEERSQSPTGETEASAKIGKLDRVKRRAGSLPEKHASHQPVQQGASQQAHAAPVEKAGVVVGHTKAIEANRMPRRTPSKRAGLVTAPTCCVTSISGLSGQRHWPDP